MASWNSIRMSWLVILPVLPPRTIVSDWVGTLAAIFESACSSPRAVVRVRKPEASCMAAAGQSRQWARRQRHLAVRRTCVLSQSGLRRRSGRSVSGADESGGYATAGVVGWPVAVTQTSRLETVSALRSMNSLRGSTWSPISVVNIRSASVPSSAWTCNSVRLLGSMVVSHN